MTIIDLLKENSIPHFVGPGHRHVRAGWCGVDCFQCSPNSSKFKLGINLSSLSCKCWGCSTIPLHLVLHHLLRIPQQEALVLARQLRGTRTPYAYKPSILNNQKVTIPIGVGELQEPHRRYLQSRGFDPDELVDIWNIQGIGVAPRMSWRLFIPIYYENEMVSWVTRSISDEVSLRYINASPEQEKMHHKHLLYGEDMVRHSIIVVEGPTDAWRIGPGAVATLGLNYTPEQVRRIACYPVRTICFDNEAIGRYAANKLADTLSAWPGETNIINICSGKDPATASEEDIKELRQRFLE